MLVQDATDETGFLQLVSTLITAAATAHETPSFYVVKVDNWFGPKWLGFNHKILGAAGTSVRDSAAPRLVPPFTPARILSTRHYVQSRTNPRETHLAGLHVYQASEDNAHRTIDRVMPEDGAFWWSGGSRGNGRGSLMAYLPGHGGHVGWYVNFKRNIESVSGDEATAWTPAQLRGTTRQELRRYLNSGDKGAGQLTND